MISKTGNVWGFTLRLLDAAVLLCLPVFVIWEGSVQQKQCLSYHELCSQKLHLFDQNAVMFWNIIRRTALSWCNLNFISSTFYLIGWFILKKYFVSVKTVTVNVDEVMFIFIIFITFFYYKDQNYLVEKKNLHFEVLLTVKKYWPTGNKLI